MTNILKISEAASIALHAMIILAKSQGNELISVKFISEKLDVSANHLSKVMQRLVKSELVESIKGNKGGFKLAQKPQEIALIDIYEAIDGKFKPSGCLLGREACDSEKCILGDLVKSINKQVEDHFKTQKLSAFLE